MGHDPPYHGVLAVKGCMRFAHWRLGRLSPPWLLRCAVLGRFRAIPPEQLEHDHVAAFYRLWRLPDDSRRAWSLSASHCWTDPRCR